MKRLFLVGILGWILSYSINVFAGDNYSFTEKWQGRLLTGKFVDSNYINDDESLWELTESANDAGYFNICLPKTDKVPNRSDNICLYAYSDTLRLGTADITSDSALWKFREGNEWGDGKKYYRIINKRGRKIHFEHGIPETIYEDDNNFGWWSALFTKDLIPSPTISTDTADSSVYQAASKVSFTDEPYALTTHVLNIPLDKVQNDGELVIKMKGNYEDSSQLAYIFAENPNGTSEVYEGEGSKYLGKHDYIGDSGKGSCDVLMSNTFVIQKSKLEEYAKNGSGKVTIRIRNGANVHRVNGINGKAKCGGVHEVSLSIKQDQNIEPTAINSSPVINNEEEAFKYNVIINRWKNNISLSLNGNSEWIFEPIAGTSYINIRERDSQKYLNIEQGSLQSSTIESYWWSAQWILEDAGNGYTRIKNRWKNDIYLNIESGELQASSIKSGWWSAQWNITEKESLAANNSPIVEAATYVPPSPSLVGSLLPENSTPSIITATFTFNQSTYDTPNIVWPQNGNTYCFGTSCSGFYPKNTNCYSDRVLDNKAQGIDTTVEIWKSPSCKTKWTRTTTKWRAYEKYVSVMKVAYNNQYWSSGIYIDDNETIEENKVKPITTLPTYNGDDQLYETYSPMLFSENSCEVKAYGSLENGVDGVILYEKYCPQCIGSSCDNKEETAENTITCSGVACNGQDPEITFCAKDATINNSKTITVAGVSFAEVNYFWSPTCKTNWTQVNVLNPNQQANLYAEIYDLQNSSYYASEYKYTNIIYSPMVYAPTDCSAYSGGSVDGDRVEVYQSGCLGSTNTPIPDDEFEYELTPIRSLAICNELLVKKVSGSEVGRKTTACYGVQTETTNSLDYQSVVDSGKDITIGTWKAFYNDAINNGSYAFAVPGTTFTALLYWIQGEEHPLDKAANDQLELVDASQDLLLLDYNSPTEEYGKYIVLAGESAFILKSGINAVKNKDAIISNIKLLFTESKIKAAKKFGVSVKWIDDSGALKWPKNDGFLGVPQEITLKKGTKIDRYGESIKGAFLSPVGTPFEQRSLPLSYKDTKQLHQYEIMKPLPVKSGTTAPWFDQPGGGTQFKLLEGWDVDMLIRDGYLKEI